MNRKPSSGRNQKHAHIGDDSGVVALFGSGIRADYKQRLNNINARHNGRHKFFDDGSIESLFDDALNQADSIDRHNF